MQHFSSPLQWKHRVLTAGLRGKSLSTSYVDLLRIGPGKWAVSTLQPLLLYHWCTAQILPSFLYLLAFEILLKVLLSFLANKPLPSFIFLSSLFFFWCLGYAPTFSYFPSYASYDLSRLFIFISVSLDCQLFRTESGLIPPLTQYKLSDKHTVLQQWLCLEPGNKGWQVFWVAWGFGTPPLIYRWWTSLCAYWGGDDKGNM